MSEDGSLAAQAKERLGRVLKGKYRLDRLLGVGGMASVYAATHRNGKAFAVKVLHPAPSLQPGLRARFLREGYVANAVQHPSVVSILDDDVDEDGSAFLVMELLDGATLESLCSPRGQRLPVPAALCLLHQLLDVLAAAHARDIVHRDVKPANLFLLRDGQLKVLDFGIARLHEPDPDTSATQTGQILGTPAFMAPEQARGEGNGIDARTDVWAAGATLFTLLSGELVHEGDNGRMVLVQAATSAARPLSELAPELPAGVLEIVTKALEFAPSARFQTASEMRDAIERAHLELFGPLSREPLKPLLASLPAPLETAHTEPFKSRPRSELPEPAHTSDARTTTAKPVITHSDSARASNLRRGALAGLGLLGFLGLSLALVFAGEAPVASKAESPPPTRESSVAAEPAAPSTPATASEAPAAPPSATGAAPAPDPGERPRPRSEASRAKPAAPRPATSREPAASPPAAASSGRRNPLSIELQ
jgi:serine/threonine-protein kinase